MNRSPQTLSLEQQLALPHPIRTPGHDFVLAIALAARMLSARVRAWLKHTGLTEAQLNILLLLQYQFEEGTSQVELSKRMFVNRANVTGLIDRLERDGLAKRRPGRGDRRVKWVQITDAGRKALAGAELIYFEGIKRVAGTVPEGERQAALQAILALCESLKESEA